MPASENLHNSGSDQLLVRAVAEREPAAFQHCQSDNLANDNSSPTLRCHRRGAQRRRRGIRDLGVDLLAQAGNTCCTHDCAVYTYRHAAAQHQDAGSDEGRSALIYVILDLRRRPL
jgi:hypothetical protein